MIFNLINKTTEKIIAKIFCILKNYTYICSVDKAEVFSWHRLIVLAENSWEAVGYNGTLADLVYALDWKSKERGSNPRGSAKT